MVFCFLQRLTVMNGYRNFSNVGFVGLGNMGNSMAKNLLKKGHKLTVYDTNKSVVMNLVKAGARGASSAEELSKESNIIITMLPTNDHVWDSYTGEKVNNSSVGKMKLGDHFKSHLLNELNINIECDRTGSRARAMGGAQKNAIFIDSSTIDPLMSQKISIETLKKGAKFLDGPVSGGVVGARDGTLTFMVGGNEDVYKCVKSVLEAMGTRIVHCGDVGMGQVAKLCNNMLLAISMIGVSEVVNLADRLGLDPKVMLSILNTSTGRCWSSEIYPPIPGVIDSVPSSNNYQGGFMTSLMTKDLGLAQSAATRSNTAIPLGSLAHQIYRILMSHGHEQKDFSVVYQYFKNFK